MFLLLLASIPSPLEADVSITSWGLVLDARDFDTTTYKDAAFLTVTNPFADAHAVSLPPPNDATTAAAQYLIAWIYDSGSFHITSQLAAQDGHHVRSEAYGTIDLQSDSDLSFHVDGRLDYILRPTTWTRPSPLRHTTSTPTRRCSKAVNRGTPPSIPPDRAH